MNKNEYDSTLCSKGVYKLENIYINPLILFRIILQELSMAFTRSMSGATKKIEKVPKQKSKPKLKPYTIEKEAYQVFM